MGIAERRQRQRQSLRREILDAARDMFLAEGYEAVTMRRLAERIEYSPTTIYLHFRDKDDLFEALCEETFGELAARLGKLAKRGLPPLENLREGLRLYADFGLKHPSHYALTFMHVQKPADVKHFHESVGHQAFEYLRRAVAACVECGAFEAGDVEASAQALWAATHGVVSLLIAHGAGFPFVSRRTLIDHTIDTMIAGLRAS